MKKIFQWKWIIIAIVILFILFAFKLNSRTSVLSKNGAIEKVKIFSEVKDYFKRVHQAQVVVSGEENNSYLIQVYEIKDGHTATFNWYSVDKITGDVKKEF